MHVVATAGHVDHGKSALVRALTSIEPDRWAEEQRRGLTIDLGFAWTDLPEVGSVAFVDVPGHQRFLGNMLAGLGPSPVVLFVVAADEGWRAQSGDHRDALAALGIDRGLIVISRADLAPERVESAIAAARQELARTGLADAAVVVTSARTGEGLAELRDALDRLLAATAQPDPTDRVRLWVDRAFTVRGAGTVVTGTLASGCIDIGDEFILTGHDAPRTCSVRGIESLGRQQDRALPTSRVALNLRGVGVDHVRRGDALVSPDAWWSTTIVDVRRVGSQNSLHDAPTQLLAHVGTAAVPARLRPFDAEHARLTLDRRLPIALGDRFVLRDPGRRVVGGAVVLDADPPALTRRGDARRRGDQLARMSAHGDIAAELLRRAAARPSLLRQLGLNVPAAPPEGVLDVAGWWVDGGAWSSWITGLQSAVTALAAGDPLAAGLSRGAVVDELDLPSQELVAPVVHAAGLRSVNGFVSSGAAAKSLGSIDAAVALIEERLERDFLAAPTADELNDAGLGPKQLAAAERVGRLIRLGGGDIVLLPSAPAQAMRVLSAVEQPFTTSAAREALGSTRRVVVPLLEHLDGRGWTRRIDGAHREVVRRPV